MIDIGSAFQQSWQSPQCLIQAGPEAKEARFGAAGILISGMWSGLL
jgi:hypothetical protein